MPHKTNEEKRQELDFLKEKIRKGVGSGIGRGDPRLARFVARAKVLAEEISESRKRPIFRKATIKSVRSQLRRRVGRANVTRPKKRF